MDRKFESANKTYLISDQWEINFTACVFPALIIFHAEPVNEDIACIHG